jgi:hypothetical protein
MRVNILQLDTLLALKRRWLTYAVLHLFLTHFRVRDACAKREDIYEYNVSVFSVCLPLPVIFSLQNILSDFDEI